MNEAYFDNSATTALCDAAKNAIISACDIYGNPSSLHSLGTASADILQNVREKIAGQLNASPDEIYFTSGGTESDNMAIVGAAKALHRRGKKIVTTAFEHSAVINTMKQLENDGFEVVYLKPDESGTVPISSFLDAIDEHTILVSVMSVNNETGAFLPIDKIKKAIVRKNSPALFHCDATQSFMKYSVVPKKCGIDLMTVSAHKIHGPKGVGALYIRKGVRILPRTFGGEQEKGLRPGTEPLILINGFGAAIDDFGDSDENAEKCRKIKNYIKEKLENCEDIVINSPSQSSDYILNLSVLGIRSETMLHFLEQRKVFVSSGSACAKGKPSHVLTALGLNQKRADSAIRISFSKFNDFEQADHLIDGISEAKSVLIKSK
ncbi:MAG: cysteine desulfurase family protein [Acutalibacteraceae bacterium]